MKEKNKPDFEAFPKDSQVKVIPCDHIKIVDKDSGKELLNKRG